MTTTSSSTSPPGCSSTAAPSTAARPASPCSWCATSSAAASIRFTASTSRPRASSPSASPVPPHAASPKPSPPGEVEKTYLAVVRGVVPEEGLIDHPLVEELDRYGDPLAEPDKGPQAAVTAFRRLAAVELPFAVGRYPTSRYSLVEARPHTGRRHQLRRHFKHLLHPDHRRHQVRRGASQPLLPRRVRLSAPAPRRRRARLRPPLQRSTVASRRAPGGGLSGPAWSASAGLVPCPRAGGNSGWKD